MLLNSCIHARTAQKKKCQFSFFQIFPERDIGGCWQFLERMLDKLLLCVPSLEKLACTVFLQQNFKVVNSNRDYIGKWNSWQLVGRSQYWDTDSWFKHFWRPKLIQNDRYWCCEWKKRVFTKKLFLIFCWVSVLSFWSFYSEKMSFSANFAKISENFALMNCVICFRTLQVSKNCKFRFPFCKLKPWEHKVSP